MPVTLKQISGVFLLGLGGSLLGAVIAALLFGVGCWVLLSLGILEKSDAMLKVKVAVSAFALLGLVLSLVRAFRMIL